RGREPAKPALEGDTPGPTSAPGKTAPSRLPPAATGTPDAPSMPPKRPRLDAREIALLRRWIDEGAKAPASETVQTSGSKSKHWSFQPIRRPTLPAVKDEQWVRNPIDRFILARLEKEQIHPSPEADRATLIRRVSLDLSG